MMNDWARICKQIGKQRFQQTANRWLKSNDLQNEGEFDNHDAVPYGMSLPYTNNAPDVPSFKKIKKQVGKKKVSKKSKKERITDKNLKLAESLGCIPYK